MPGELSGITLGSEHRSAAPWAVSSSLSEDKTFQLKYNIYTQELSVDNEIKIVNTIDNTILFELFVNLCFL